MAALNVSRRPEKKRLARLVFIVLAAVVADIMGFSGVAGWPTVVFTLDTWENEKEKLSGTRKVGKSEGRKVGRCGWAVAPFYLLGSALVNPQGRFLAVAGQRRAGREEKHARRCHMRCKGAGTGGPEMMTPTGLLFRCLSEGTAGATDSS